MYIFTFDYNHKISINIFYWISLYLFIFNSLYLFILKTLFIDFVNKLYLWLIVCVARFSNKHYAKAQTSLLAPLTCFRPKHTPIRSPLARARVGQSPGL